MISQNDYKNALGLIGRKFNNVNINWHSWYMQYSYYETMWENYFQIFITNYSNQNEPTDIRFVFWESCPGGMPFPHQNYAFDSNRFDNPIHGTFDSYLKDVCVKFGVPWELNGKKRKIGDLIIELSQNGILIIDLYPTHGISLDSTNRVNLFKNLFQSYSKDKLGRIGNSTSTYPKNNHNIKVTEELWNAGINNEMDLNIKYDIKDALGLKTGLEFYI
jgi:hypothetical protein